MNYELSKELKDAGFSQVGNNYDWVSGEKVEIYNKDLDCCYIPTLEELIEACGDTFLGLNKRYINGDDYWEWGADTHTHPCDCDSPKCSGFNWEHETGKTMQEAVAKLWLALNKK